MDYNKYESYIKIGHTATGTPSTGYVCSDLVNFPTPSSLGRTLRDQDKDPFTDLLGYTHRNRVRHDVEELRLEYNILSDTDEAFILNAIAYEWIYVEVIDKKTKAKKTHKMYASDKAWDTFKVWKDVNNVWHEETTAFSFSLVEE